MVQELPERLAFPGDAGLCPLARAPRRAGNRLLDLQGRLGRGARVVDAYIDRTIALAAQPRHKPGAQNRGFSQSRLTEEDGQKLALHASCKLGDLLFATKEVSARLLGE